MNMKKIKKLKLKEWCELEDIRERMDTAAEGGEIGTICDQIFKYIQLCTTEDKELEQLPWLEVAKLFNECVSENVPSKDFPIFSEKKSDKGGGRFDYNGRTWYFWLNIFAKNYGWQRDEIAILDIDVAVGLYQEILFLDQEKKEWEWGLSEKSLSYNKSTKSSKFVPLDRPDWMKPATKKRKIPKTKIRRDMIPQGNVINLDTDE
jgi:hypothetical protein